MEDTQFVLLWKEHYDKIDRSLAINQRLLTETVNHKAQSVLRSLSRFKTRGMMALVVYLLLLGTILFFALAHYSSAANYFIFSIGMIFLINLRALYDYGKHLVWINQIDYDGSITAIQQKLVRLQLSIFRHSRIMVLQFPFWTTFFLSNRWFPQSVGWGYLVIQIALTASFTYLAIWLYQNQTPANADKKWIRALLAGSGADKVSKALAFYKELETFQQTI
ncbi:MAG: hypothetical protein KGO92_11360 [Bacteroidota bacterium]|nr:hypothetical protein [Bacteroidota bacterium]